MGTVGSRKMLTRIVVILIVLVGVIASVYGLAGKRIVADLYHGNLPLTSIQLVDSDPDRPLDYFLNRTDIIVWQFIVIGLPMTILLHFLLYLAFRGLLAAQRESVELSKLIPPREFRYDTLVALLIYTVLTVTFAYRTFDQFTTAMIGPPGDNLFFFWNYWWMNEKILTGAGNLAFTDMMFYPEGTSMYYHSWSFFNLGLSVVLRQFFSPFTSFNVIALHSFPLAGVAGFMLVKYITRNSYLALLGGFLFTFSPYHFARVPHHMNLAAIQFIPLFILYYIKSVQSNSRRHVAAASIFFLLNTLCSWVYMIFACIFILSGYVYLGIRRRRVVLTDVLLKSAVIVGAAVIVISPWLWNMIMMALHNPGVGAPGRSVFVTDVAGLITPGHYHWLTDLLPLEHIHGLFSGNLVEAATYLGIPALLLVIVMSFKQLPAIARYLAGCLTFFVLSLGPELHILGLDIPVALPDSIIAFVPLISNVRAPARYMIYVYLFWSIIVPIATAYYVSRVRSGRWKRIAIIVLPLLLVIDYAKPIDEMTEVIVPGCYSSIADRDDNPVILDLPLGYMPLQYYKYYQTFHGFPTVQGYASRKVNESLIDRIDFNDLDHQKQQLKLHGVRFIVIHTDMQTDNTVDPNEYAEVYETVCKDSQTIVFQVY